MFRACLRSLFAVKALLYAESLMQSHQLQCRNLGLPQAVVHACQDNTYLHKDTVAEAAPM